MNFGVVIKVNDLYGCRYFYREVLGLGEPLLDSSFATRFRIGDGVSLVLEKTEARFLEHASGAVCWYWTTDNFEALKTRMEKNGTPLSDAFSEGGQVFRRGCDPEGNVFLIGTSETIPAGAR